MIGCSALVLVLLGIVLLHYAFGGSGPAGTSTQFTCESASCGNKWEGKASNDPVKCPKCGSQSFTTSWYVCPACKGCAGVEVRTSGHAQFNWRAKGQTEWLNNPPETLTCPSCNKTFSVKMPSAFGWEPPKK